MVWYVTVCILQVYKSKKYEMKYDKRTATLKICDTEITDATVYKVEAANKAGRCDSEAMLNVQGTYLPLHVHVLPWMLCHACGPRLCMDP